ncbi:MAG: hypothetical protein WD066_04365, partial [Planctomycetaceae bacterium]
MKQPKGGRDIASHADLDRRSQWPSEKFTEAARSTLTRPDEYRKIASKDLKERNDRQGNRPSAKDAFRRNARRSSSGEMTEWPIVRHWKCRVL